MSSSMLKLSNIFFTLIFDLEREYYQYWSIFSCPLKGSSELYADKLKAKYLGDVPIYSPFYAATEGLLGINLWPKEDRAVYMLVPRAMFYEFIPVEESSEEQPTVCMKQSTSELNPFLKLVLDIPNANLSIEGNVNLFNIRRSCIQNNGGPIVQLLGRLPCHLQIVRLLVSLDRDDSL